MRVCAAALLASCLVSPAAAQTSIADRMRATGTRTVAFSAPSRPETCGDGSTYLSDGLGSGHAQFFNDYYDVSSWSLKPCERGPLRVTVRMVDGQAYRLRTSIGPLAVLGDTVLDLGAVGTANAAAYLRELARSGEGRIAEQALLPLLLVDSTPRWEILAAAARDSTRLLRYRRRASDLLARGAASTLGAAAFSDDPAASERRTAVDAIAHPRNRYDDPVPDLLEIARANKHPDARAAAIYQLGQRVDDRAVTLFAALLGISPK